MMEKIKRGFKTALVIVGIYILFILYLLFLSDRVEKLDNRSREEIITNTLKIG